MTRYTEAKGFTLLEILISLGVLMLIIGILMAFLGDSERNVQRGMAMTELRESSRTVLDQIVNDLSNLGLGINEARGQPAILLADAYQLVFCADLDRYAPADQRWGALCFYSKLPSFSPEPDGNRFHLVERFLPVGYRRDWSPCERNLIEGAEVVRYSLDYVGNGHFGGLAAENLDDRIFNLSWESLPVTEQRGQATGNPYDFYLVKESWGTAWISETEWDHIYSGPQVLARHVRGFIADDGFAYPNGELPQPLFRYWGHFENDPTTPDDPAEPGWPGEELDLWGDVQPLYGDGELNKQELAALYSVNSLYRVSYLPEEDEDGNGALDFYEDRNGNGVRDAGVGDAIRKIDTCITLETPEPDARNPEPAASTAGLPYPYRIFSDSRSVGRRL